MQPETAVPSTPGSRNETSSTPSQTGIPSIEVLPYPSSIPSSVILGNTIFECKLDNVAGVSLQSLQVSTQLKFKLGYSVESSFNDSEYIDNMEEQILITAVAGALQCDNVGYFFNDTILELMERSNKMGVVMNTTRMSETCRLSSIPSCQVFETEFQVFVNQRLDAEAVEFLGYMLVRDKMNDGTFAEIVPYVDRCEYLRPLPLLPPVGDEDGSNEQISQDESERLSVSPWSLATLSLLSEY
jgi:hypothetical protein